MKGTNIEKPEKAGHSSAFGKGWKKLKRTIRKRDRRKAKNNKGVDN